MQQTRQVSSEPEDTVEETPNETNPRTIRVPTFSPRTNSITKKSERGDAFLRYSNDEVRMQTLMMSTATRRDTQQTEAQVVDRKTRISFELHPSLIMEDMLRELGDDDEDSGNDSSIQDMISSFMQTDMEDELSGSTTESSRQ